MTNPTKRGARFKQSAPKGLNACRHYLGFYPSNRPACSMGRDVRAWALRCNGGSEFGIGLRLPCTRRDADADAPLFDCPELDRETDEEVAERRKSMSDRMVRLISGIGDIQAMKKKMIANSLSCAKATCPWCGKKDALKLTCAIGVNNHVHCRCTACGEGLME